ncbi:hypothetical protein LCGC14_2015330 [marine sediment metagenome]|uniref:Uncharacterized protein n=1 Tax=marine sediment metagenome TaxID=412755 RepID=A0A0F9HCH4_9ZZZZ
MAGLAIGIRSGATCLLAAILIVLGGGLMLEAAPKPADEKGKKDETPDGVRDLTPLIVTLPGPQSSLPAEILARMRAKLVAKTGGMPAAMPTSAPDAASKSGH